MSSKEQTKKVKILVERNATPTSFEKWAKPGHFSRTLAKGPKTTTWIWNLHADAHDFDSQTNSLEEVSRKIFSAHFGQLAVIFLWLSGMHFHGAYFSNYLAWLNNPTTIKPSAQVVWPIVGQEILNADVGGNFQGVQITSGFFQLWRSQGITSEIQLYWTAIGGLIMSGLMLFAGWFHYHKAAPKLEWFQNAESMLNHHLSILLGLGCLSWSGHQIHISLPINKLLDAGVAPQEIPLPHEFIVNRDLIAQLYPSFQKGLVPFFSGNWGEYSDFLTFKGGVNPVTGGLWLTDTAHHHLALAVLFIFAHHMYAMPPYPYIATDYATQLSLFTHHAWIGGFCIVGGAAHGAIFMVRDYNPAKNYNNLLDRVIRHRDSIIAHLNWVSIFLGFHSFGLYIHNDTMRALGRSQDMFSDSAIQLQPIFAQMVQNLHLLAPGSTAPNALTTTSYVFGGDVVSVGSKIAIMPIKLGTADFMVHHIHAFTIHVTVLILLKGVLYARSSKLIP